MSMFPDKQWWLGDLKKLIYKIDDTGRGPYCLDRRSAPGSGRPRTACVADKIDEVDDVLSQENAPNRHTELSDILLVRRQASHRRIFKE